MNRDLKVKGGAAAVLAILFAAGIALGFAVARDQALTVGDPASDDGNLSAGRPQPPEDWMIDHLELDPVQRAQVDSVVEHFGARMSSLQKEYRPRYRAIVDSAAHALRGLLTEEQLAQYDSLQAAAKRGAGGVFERPIP
jgi:hypothetical protein